VVRGLPSRAARAQVFRGTAAAFLALCAAGCSETTSNAALTVSGSSGPTVAFESIDGPPVGVFNRLVDNMSAEAQSRNVAIASREGGANYRVRGYLAAQVVRGRTHISWVWDVYDDVKVRALRIRGDSMVESGIRDGDIVIVRKQRTAENGQTVVALSDSARMKEASAPKRSSREALAKQKKGPEAEKEPRSLSFLFCRSPALSPSTS